MTSDSNHINLAPVSVHCVIAELKMGLHNANLRAFQKIRVLQLEENLGKAFS